jgi:hypothetical protein
MSPGERARALLVGAAAGALGGFFGVGGGIVLIPMLIGVFGLTQHQAHGTSLAVIGATALGGLVVYGMMGQVDWVTALVAGIGSAIAAPLGARWAARTSASGLRQAFAVFMALVALRLLWIPPEVATAPLLAGPARVAFDVALGGTVGLLAGFMGVGGGVLAVPLLTMVIGMSQHQAQGTSLGLMLITAPAGTLEHARHGNLVTRLAPTAALGALVAAPLGGRLAQTLSNDLLLKGFAVFMLASALAVWRGALGQPRRGRVSPSV